MKRLLVLAGFLLLSTSAQSTILPKDVPKEFTKCNIKDAVSYWGDYVHNNAIYLREFDINGDGYSNCGSFYFVKEKNEDGTPKLMSDSVRSWFDKNGNHRPDKGETYEGF